MAQGRHDGGGGRGRRDWIHRFQETPLMAPEPSFCACRPGGSRMPASRETVDKGLHYIHQEGQQVFKYAVRKMYETCMELLANNGLQPKDVNAFIPHQANRRIINATAERLGIPEERVTINLGEYGNTTCATIPLATRDAIGRGKLKKGDIVLFAGVGAGYTAGGNLWRWEM